MNGQPGFTQVELASLDRLRVRYHAGTWPRPVNRSFANKHGITMGIELLTVHPDRQLYRCSLFRAIDGSRLPQIEVMFQVTTGRAEPPEPDEVLCWMVASALCAANGDQLDVCTLLLGRRVNVQGERPIRGILRDVSSYDEFFNLIDRESQLLRAFLGSEGLQELIVEVNHA